MATILEALKGVNAYPVPLRTLVGVAEGRGVELTGEASFEVMNGKAFNLAVADLLLWLAFAPDISQGGQTYSFTDEQRLQLRNRANKLYNKYLDDEEESSTAVYGYKGSRL